MKNKKFKLLIVFFTISVTVFSQTLGNNLSIHGYGGWAYGISDGNNYINATQDGNFDNLYFAMNTIAKPTDKLSIVGQINWFSKESNISTELSYAFAEWAFSDVFKVRLGRVKHVFGLYAEVYNVGTIRPFYSLPQGIYGHADMIAEGYNGISFTGTILSKTSSWGIQYDVYGGQFDYKSFEPWEVLDEEVEDKKERSNSVGGRLNIITGLEGLEFGVSYYYGENQGEIEEDEEEEVEGESNRSVIGFHIQYLKDNFQVKAEYTHLYDGGISVLNEENVDASYLEASYKLENGIQFAGRYDFSNAIIGGYPTNSLTDHKDISIGLNYWFSPNLVIKSSYHYVNGNRYAIPEDLTEEVQNNALEDITNVFQLGVHYSF